MKFCKSGRTLRALHTRFFLDWPFLGLERSSASRDLDSRGKKMKFCKAGRPLRVRCPRLFYSIEGASIL